MKRLFALVFLFSSLAVMAQRQRNYIYLFDCTKSMENVNHIWSESKEFMKEDIEQLDGNANVTVILFHQNETTFQFKAKDFNWKEIEGRCDEMFDESKLTGICNAWDSGLKFIDKNRNNYLYLFTDGTENVNAKKTSAVCARIKQWCKQDPNNYAFFVALGDEIKKTPDVNKLIEATSSCERTFFIEEHQGPFGAFDKTEFSMNIHSIKDINVGFSDYGSFDAEVECNDPHYLIDLHNNRIENGRAVFSLKEKNVPTGNFQLHFKIKTDDSVLHICNPDFYINIDTRELANIDLAQPSGISEGQYNAGIAETYSSFLFWSGKDSISLYVDFSSVFNELAITRNASLKMKVEIPSDIKGKCLFSYNGKPFDNSFEIKSSDSNSVLSLTVPHELAETEFLIGLQGISNKLETINSEETSSYISSIYFKHEICWNPLKTFLFWFCIIVIISAAFWFGLFKPLIFPRIRLNRIELSNSGRYYINKRINGARKVVVTNCFKPQNFFNKFFTGKIVFIKDDIWTSEWELKPIGRKKALKINLHGKYAITPVTSELNVFGEYKLTGLNINNLSITLKLS